MNVLSGVHFFVTSRDIYAKRFFSAIFDHFGILSKNLNFIAVFSKKNIIIDLITWLRYCYDKHHKQISTSVQLWYDYPRDYQTTNFKIIISSKSVEMAVGSYISDGKIMSDLNVHYFSEFTVKMRYILSQMPIFLNLVFDIWFVREYSREPNLNPISSYNLTFFSHFLSVFFILPLVYLFILLQYFCVHFFFSLSFVLVICFLLHHKKNCIVRWKRNSQIIYSQ